jgi:hypothetical protein
VKLLAGKISCLIGIVFAVVGVLTTILAYGASIVVGAVGVVFGILGHPLGSRWLGILTVILCIVASSSVLPRARASFPVSRVTGGRARLAQMSSSAKS